MPICSSRLHQYGPHPRLLPAQAFYVNRQGNLISECRFCRQVRTALVKQQGTSRVPVRVLIHAWRAHTAMHQRRTVRQHAPPGERWCSRGHFAAARVFSPRRSYCRDCEAISTIYQRARRVGQPITWDAASARHFTGHQAMVRSRNRTALPGTRWCSRHGGYFTLPAHWRGWKPNQLCYCPDCRRVLAREFKQRQRQAQQREAAD